MYSLATSIPKLTLVYEPLVVFPPHSEQVFVYRSTEVEDFSGKGNVQRYLSSPLRNRFATLEQILFIGPYISADCTIRMARANFRIVRFLFYFY